MRLELFIILSSSIISFWIINASGDTMEAEKHVSAPVYEVEVRSKTLDSDRLMALVNNHRYYKDLYKLKLDSGLCEIALDRLQDIKTDWSHDKFHEKVDYYFTLVESSHLGENLAKGYQDESTTFIEWVRSPTHYKNIIHTKFTKHCIECDGNYCVHIFGD